MKLTASTRPIDSTRTYRAMLAWLDGDQVALDFVLDEVMADPVGVPSLLFELIEIATDTSVTLDRDVRERLREALLRAEGAS